MPHITFNDRVDYHSLHHQKQLDLCRHSKTWSGLALINICMHTKITSLECIVQDEYLTSIFLSFFFVILLDWTEICTVQESTFIKAEIFPGLKESLATWFTWWSACLSWWHLLDPNPGTWQLLSTWKYTDWILLLPRVDNESTELILWESRKWCLVLGKRKHIPKLSVINTHFKWPQDSW